MKVDLIAATRITDGIRDIIRNDSSQQILIGETLSGQSTCVRGNAGSVVDGKGLSFVAGGVIAEPNVERSNGRCAGRDDRCTDRAGAAAVRSSAGGGLVAWRGRFAAGARRHIR